MFQGKVVKLILFTSWRVTFYYLIGNGFQITNFSINILLCFCIMVYHLDSSKVSALKTCIYQCSFTICFLSQCPQGGTGFSASGVSLKATKSGAAMMAWHTHTLTTVYTLITAYICVIHYITAVLHNQKSILTLYSWFIVCRIKVPKEKTSSNLCILVLLRRTCMLHYEGPLSQYAAAHP